MRRSHSRRGQETSFSPSIGYEPNAQKSQHRDEYGWRIKVTDAQLKVLPSWSWQEPGRSAFIEAFRRLIKTYSLTFLLKNKPEKSVEASGSSQHNGGLTQPSFFTPRKDARSRYPGTADNVRLPGVTVLATTVNGGRGFSPAYESAKRDTGSHTPKQYMQMSVSGNIGKGVAHEAAPRMRHSLHVHPHGVEREDSLLDASEYSAGKEALRQQRCAHFVLSPSSSSRKLASESPVAHDSRHLSSADSLNGQHANSVDNMSGVLDYQQGAHASPSEGRSEACSSEMSRLTETQLLKRELLSEHRKAAKQDLMVQQQMQQQLLQMQQQMKQQREMIEHKMERLEMGIMHARKSQPPDLLVQHSDDDWVIDEDINFHFDEEFVWRNSHTNCLETYQERSFRSRFWTYLTSILPKTLWCDVDELDIRALYARMIKLNSPDVLDQIDTRREELYGFVKGSMSMRDWLSQLYQKLDELATMRAPVEVDFVKRLFRRSLKADVRYKDALRDLQRNPQWDIPMVRVHLEAAAWQVDDLVDKLSDAEKIKQPIPKESHHSCPSSSRSSIEGEDEGEDTDEGDEGDEGDDESTQHDHLSDSESENSQNLASAGDMLSTSARTMTFPVGGMVRLSNSYPMGELRNCAGQIIGDGVSNKICLQIVHKYNPSLPTEVDRALRDAIDTGVDRDWLVPYHTDADQGSDSGSD